ncbi:hypothetical protein G210_0999 [Candida maltosa Xu316]|uniref:Uncharacterized protein n=1 Tax=Candida maltosa (strain Xu316) TaxID=1245528 RepID=M3J8J4_CANMX|nr:hypothetical protein G210_0999 [Candida maltosa Xu316]
MDVSSCFQDNFSTLVRTYHETLLELVTVYDLYLSYKKRQMGVLLSLQLGHWSNSRRKKLEMSWVVLQNSILVKHSQLWADRRILNECMLRMVNQGHISTGQLFEYNHNIVEEIQLVQTKYTELIESETSEVYGFEEMYMTNEEEEEEEEEEELQPRKSFAMSILDKKPEVFTRVLELHSCLIQKYYIRAESPCLELMFLFTV